jgi:peroxiredoxin
MLCVLRAIIGAIGCAVLLTPVVRSQDLPRATPFRLPTLEEGTACSLEETLSKGPVVIVFWTTCCRGTETAMIQMQRLYEKYHEAGLELLAVCGNDNRTASQVRPWVIARRLTYPVLLDPRADVRRLYQIERVPHFVFVDQQGRIRYRHSGFRPGDEVIIEQQMLALLKPAVQ